MNAAIRQMLQDSFRRRACFCCRKKKWCRHREIKVELAILEVESRKGLKPLPEPPLTGIHPNSILSVLVKRQLAGTVNKETPDANESY